MNIKKKGRRFGELVQRILAAAKKANHSTTPKHGRYVTTRGACLRWFSTFVDNLDDREYRKYAQAVHRLHKTGLIALGNQRVSLTIAGEKTLREFEEATSLRTDFWDGIWRIVIWDIPESARHNRDVVRRHLKELGFVGIQKSVWVCPWPCRGYIQAVRDRMELQRGILFFETDHLEAEEQLMAYFNIQKPSGSLRSNDH